MTSSLNTWVHIEDDEPLLPAAYNDYRFTEELPSEWEFTRAGAALGRGPDGRWTSYAANVLRPHHDPVTKQNLGVILEPARTQLITTPRPLTATAVECTTPLDTTTQTPFGLGGRSFIPTAVSGFHGFNMFFGGVNRASAIPDGAVVSVRLVFKPLGTFSRGMLLPQLRTGAYQSVEFTTADGGSILSSSVLRASIKPDTDGFFCLEATIAYGTGTTGGSASFSFLTPTGVRGFVGDGVSGMLVAYYGAEIGAECTSPIIPANGVTTRPEDNLQSAATWLTPGPKVLALQYTPLSTETQVVLGTGGPDGLELGTSDRSIFYTTTTPAGSVGPLSGTAPAAGIERTTAITVINNYFLLVENGRLLAFSESGSLPNQITSLRLGARPGGGLIGPILVKQLKFWKQEMDRDVLAAFTSDLSIPGVAPVLPVIDVQATRSIPPEDNVISMTVTLTGGPTGATVNYRTVNDTAIAGVDYTAVAGTLSFPLGESVATVSISLGTRSLLEQRSFFFEVFSPVDAVLGTTRSQVILIKAAPTAHAPLKLATFDGPLSADWSITRSTPGYSRNSSGVWTQVPANQPRIHYSGPGDVGILIEPAATQGLFDSLNFGYLLNSTQTIITTTQTPVSMRTKQWRETAITGNHLFRAFFASTAAAWPTGDLTLWALVKAVGPRTRYKFTVKGIDNVYQSATFDLIGNGSVVATSNAAVIGLIEPEPYWPGVYRIGVARPQAANADVAAEFDIGPVDPTNANSTTLAGNTAYGLDLYHFQVEAGLSWTSPIPTVTAAAATQRNADVLKAAGTWFRRESFALGVQYTRLNNVPATQRVVQFRDITPAVDDFGILTVSGVTRAPLTTGAVFQGQIDGAATVQKTPSTAVVSIDTTRYSLFVGGTKAGEISMTGKDMPRQVEHLRFGSKEQDGSQGAPIIIKKVAYWTVGLSDEEGVVFSGDLSGVPPGEVEPEPLPIVNIPATLNVPEGQSISIPVTKIGNGACSVNFRTKGQTAVAGADYTGIGDPNPAAAAARIITFAANESTKLVTFQSAADAVDEPNSEKVGIEISVFNNPPDCQIGNGVGVITIVEAAKPPDSGTIYARSKTFASVASDGGIGRPVYRVTNLRDDNSVGSLRYGINLGGRHIIFEVGGVIKMSGDWSFTKNDLTISGETAPYPGITIQGTEMSGGTIKPQASKRVHFSHINFERCLDNRVQSNTNSDCLDMAPGTGTSLEDIEFRHCSFFWSNDEMISIWPTGSGTTRGYARRISFTDCMFCEPIHRPDLLGYQPHMENGSIDPPPPSTHAYGLLTGVHNIGVDFQYSMLTDAAMRGPFIDGGCQLVIANMIALNCGKGAHINLNNNADALREPFKITCVGYLAISGPDTKSTDFAGFKIHNPAVRNYTAGSVAWIDGMYSRKGPTSSVTPKAPVWNTVDHNYPEQMVVMVNPATTARPIDIPGAPVPKLTAADIRARAIQNIGPRPKDRIPNVARKIRDLQNDTGKFVSHQSQVGGATNIAQTSRALNGSTVYSSTDSAIIPAYPTLSGNVTAADKTAVRNWLEFFLSRLQYD